MNRLTSLVAAGCASVACAGAAVIGATPASAAYANIESSYRGQCVSAGLATVRVNLSGYTDSVQGPGPGAAVHVYAACPGSPRIVRVQVDRLELDYVGPGAHSVYTRVGPVNEGTNDLLVRTEPVAEIRCDRTLQVRAVVSERDIDGQVARASAQSFPFHWC